jgi:hypothetical protein
VGFFVSARFLVDSFPLSIHSNSIPDQFQQRCHQQQRPQTQLKLELLRRPALHGLRNPPHFLDIDLRLMAWDRLGEQRIPAAVGNLSRHRKIEEPLKLHEQALVKLERLCQHLQIIKAYDLTT